MNTLGPGMEGVTVPPRCLATSEDRRCIKVAGHEGAHLNPQVGSWPKTGTLDDAQTAITHGDVMRMLRNLAALEDKIDRLGIELAIYRLGCAGLIVVIVGQWFGWLR